MISFTLLFSSCVKTPEQQYRDRIEKATEEELLSEIFNHTNIYKLVYKEFKSDELRGYQWNEGLLNNINDGLTTQVIFDRDVLYIGNHRFMGSYSSRYYSSENGRYQVTIMSREDFKSNPYIVKRVFWGNGISYNQHGKDYLHEKGIYLPDLKKHPAMKANVIVIKDTEGFVSESNYTQFKSATVVFQSLEPLGYYEGPLDKN
jgi:hypothetical protein